MAKRTSDDEDPRATQAGPVVPPAWGGFDVGDEVDDHYVFDTSCVPGVESAPVGSDRNWSAEWAGGQVGAGGGEADPGVAAVAGGQSGSFDDLSGLFGTGSGGSQGAGAARSGADVPGGSEGVGGEGWEPGGGQVQGGPPYALPTEWTRRIQAGDGPGGDSYLSAPVTVPDSSDVGSGSSKSSGGRGGLHLPSVRLPSVHLPSLHWPQWARLKRAKTVPAWSKPTTVKSFSWRRLVQWAGLVVVVIVLAVGASKALEFFAHKPPIDASNNYLLSVQAQNWSAAADLSCQGPGSAAAQSSAQELLAKVGGTLVSYDLTSATVKGNTATVNGTVSGSSSTDSIVLYVERNTSSGAWLVCSTAVNATK